VPAHRRGDGGRREATRRPPSRTGRGACGLAPPGLAAVPPGRRQPGHVRSKRSAGEYVKGDERVAAGTQFADYPGQGAGVERGVVVGVGPDVHEDDLAGPGRPEHPGGHDGDGDVACGSPQPSVSTVHRTGTYPAWLAMAMTRPLASPNGKRNRGAGSLPVTAVICRARAGAGLVAGAVALPAGGEGLFPGTAGWSLAPRRSWRAGEVTAGPTGWSATAPRRSSPAPCPGSASFPCLAARLRRRPGQRRPRRPRRDGRSGSSCSQHAPRHAGRQRS